MAVPAGVKFDDGTGGFFTNCFPARNVFRQTDDAGAWLVAQRAEQRRHFKAVLCTKPKTYVQLKHERREREKEEQRKTQQPSSPDGLAEGDGSTQGLLDGFYLLKHCCVEDPSDVCSINVAGKELTDANDKDFQLFDNAAYINAGENLLPFKAFAHFPIVRELELPLNALRGIRLDLDDFPYLEVLDLSYNNLSKDDILALGILPKLKVLYLTGNQLRSLPAEMAKPYKVSLSDAKDASVPRFPCLELLSLDDNHLTDLATFASLAGLRRLKRLNLDKNDILSVPHLRALSGGTKHVAVESEPGSAVSTPGRKSGRKSSRSSRSRSRNKSAPPGKIADSGHGTPEVTQHLTEIKERLENTISPDDDSLPEELPPPFPELEHLSLAFNKILEEESLLAVAAWPMLKELIIHDNPLTIQSSGDPPLLKRYLKDRLGISLVRRKPENGKTRPTIQVPSKPHRKVAEIVPPIPKKPLQLMLESTPSQALPSNLQPTPPPSMDAPRQSLSAPLPPITISPDCRPWTDPLHGGEDQDEQLGADKLTRTQSWTEGNFQDHKVPSSLTESVELADEPVFLTQVDDQTDETRPAHQTEPKLKTKTAKPESKDSAAYSMAVPPKFKGYEGLYDTSASPEEEPIVTDIQSNLRSLRLALKQQTHFQNEVDLNKLQKPFEPYERSKIPPRPPLKSKAEKLEDILETMKNRLVVEEVNLAKLMEDRDRLKRDYPEVLQLLQEIQAKYSSVRINSVQNSESQKESISETLQAVQELSEQLRDRKSSHGGARPKRTTRSHARSFNASTVTS